MKRALPIGFAGAVCLAALSAAIIQGRQLSDLRAEQQRLIAQLAGPEASSLAAAPQGQAGGGPATAPVSPELLRLRAEVTRLGALQRGLAPARAENERLRLRLAAAGTNNLPGLTLPPGYLRKADARMAGYNTPEDTLQSLLWALRHKDSVRVLQVFTPKVLQDKIPGFTQELLQHPEAIPGLAESGKDGNAIADDLLPGSEAIIGMAIVGKEQLPNGSVMVSVQVAPDVPPMSFHMKSVDGQWKIASLP